MGERPQLAYQPYSSKRHSQQSFTSFTSPSSPPATGGHGGAGGGSLGGGSGVESAKPSPFIRPGHARLGSGFDFGGGSRPNGRPGSSASFTSGSPPRNNHLSALANTPPRHSPLAPSGSGSGAFAHIPQIPSSSSRPQLAAVSSPRGGGSNLPSRYPSDSSALSLAPPSAPASGAASPNRPSTPAAVVIGKQGGQAPYRPGFQAKGVYRDLTDSYITSRRGKGEAKRLDESRLQKRLDKLVELHFPHPTTVAASAAATSPTSAPSRPRARPRASLSSFSSLTSLSSLAAPSPANPSGSFLSRLASTSNSSAIRDAEQAIVRWQDDRTAKQCAVCGAPFGVRTRKHHCRLCGRVVCFLPPNVGPSAPLGTSTDTSGPIRKERCSTFVTFEWDHPNSAEKMTGELVELDDDEMGLAPAASPSLSSSTGSLPAVQPALPALPKRPGVRVCRECLSVVLRRQAMTRPPITPTYMRLHEVLAKLESEVETLLEAFGETVVEMHRNAGAPPSNEALSTRKKLLSALASYDSTARRITDLPLASGNVSGGAQDRLQRAIGFRAAIFLQERMAMVRGLGGFELEKLGQPEDAIANGAASKGKRHNRNQSSLASTTTLANLTDATRAGPSANVEAASVVSDGTSEAPSEVEDRAARLAVLLEQETLVAGYLEEAQSRRQLEDAGSLKMSLDELREEIKRLKA